MSLLVCPFCQSEDIQVDEDWIIIDCPYCGESSGYRAEIIEGDYL